MPFEASRVSLLNYRPTELTLKKFLFNFICWINDSTIKQHAN